MNGVFVFAANFLGPLYAVFVERLHGDVLSISISWSIFLFSATFFGFLIARYGDKVEHKKKLLIAGYVIRAVVWILFIFVTNMWQLIILQIILGLGEAIGTPGFSAYFAEHLVDGEQVREYADWNIIGNLTTAVSTVMGGIVVHFAGFHVMFYLMSLFAVFAALVAQKRLH